ncbi:MAG: ACP S-malonyltransferase [Steroidobacteraceae bacterium]|nr:ACP S-malonyltransferase [Steroidobacteraceae bacterium]
MMSFAFVFPGQGSQSVGMLASLSGLDPVVRATFDEASAALGYDLWQLVQEGPAERLNTTECTQPAMLAAGIATARLWARRGGGEPAVVAGHSLGEFSALVCAGALEFSDAVSLVKFRGRVMQEAVPEGTGAMAAVLGLDDAAVEEACREAAQGSVVEPVNFNAPGQVVIAGEAAAVRRAIDAAKARGAKRAVPLAVSVPSHSTLMSSAAERFASRLAETVVRPPRIRYISAVDATAYSDPEQIRALLGRQLARPVRWRDTVQAIAATGVSQVIECGPGKVLLGLNKRIEVSGLTFAALEDPTSFDAALTATKG